MRFATIKSKFSIKCFFLVSLLMGAYSYSTGVANCCNDVEGALHPAEQVAFGSQIRPLDNFCPVGCIYTPDESVLIAISKGNVTSIDGAVYPLERFGLGGQVYPLDNFDPDGDIYPLDMSVPDGIYPLEISPASLGIFGLGNNFAPDRDIYPLDMSVPDGIYPLEISPASLGIFGLGNNFAPKPDAIIFSTFPFNSPLKGVY